MFEKYKSILRRFKPIFSAVAWTFEQFLDNIIFCFDWLFCLYISSLIMWVLAQQNVNQSIQGPLPSTSYVITCGGPTQNRF